jgi:nucleoside-diphosphate-sugar epimerase
MRAVVTGGAGFIGSNLVDRLLADGYSVVVIDNFSSGKAHNLAHNSGNSKLTIARRDINEDVTSDLSGADVIFHLAAIPLVQYSIEHPKEAHHANVNGMLNILMCAHKAGVKRIVFASSASVYGDQEKLPFVEDMTPNPMSPYAAHKTMGEYYCKLLKQMHGMETICLRFFNVYGPRHDPSSNYACLIPRSIVRTLKGEPIIVYGDGKQTRDFVYVGDVVDAAIKAALTQNKECFGNVMNIATGRETSVLEIANEIMSHKKSIIDFQPARQEPRRNVASVEKAQKILEWTPKTSLKEGIEKTFSYFNNANH